MMLVTEYLDKTAKCYPEKAAFIDEHRSISFKNLREESLHVAEAVIRCNLFKCPIVVYMDKCVECIVAFL